MSTPSPQSVDLSDSLWMPLDGFVPAYNLVLGHARELGLCLADVGLVLEIMYEQAQEVLERRAPSASLRNIAQKLVKTSYSFVKKRVRWLAQCGLVKVIFHKGKRNSYDFTPMYQRCWVYSKHKDKAAELIAALPPREESTETLIPDIPTRPRGRPRRESEPTTTDQNGDLDFWFGECAMEWETALERIAGKVSPAMFQNWFQGARAFKADGRITIATPTTYHKQHLETRFGNLIEVELRPFIGNMTIEYVVSQAAATA